MLQVGVEEEEEEEKEEEEEEWIPQLDFIMILNLSSHNFIHIRPLLLLM
jgi:hypothetical protein